MNKELEEKFQEMTNLIVDMANRLTALEFLVANPSGLLIKGDKKFGYSLYYVKDRHLKSVNIPNSKSYDYIKLNQRNEIVTFKDSEVTPYKFDIENEEFIQVSKGVI